MDGKKSVRVDGLSKLTKIEELREKLVEPFEVGSECQRLFYRGKQLVDGHTLFDYNVGLNEIIQILIRPPAPSEEIVEAAVSDPVEANTEDMQVVGEQVIEEESKEDLSIKKSLFKLGDVIDARDETMGAWFEAKIVKITKKSSVASQVSQPQSVEQEGEKPSASSPKRVAVPAYQEQVVRGSENKDSGSENEGLGSEYKKGHVECNEDDGFVYSIIFERYDDSDAADVRASHIRPRACHRLSLDSIEIGSRVFVNYNYDEPASRGYWYDAIVTKKKITRCFKELVATVFIGKDLVPFENCKIVFLDEIFAIEKPGAQINLFHLAAGESAPSMRENKPECDHCLDNPKSRCKHCSCSVCGEKGEPEKQLMCDECDSAYHIYCLKPPLEAIPDAEEWYCPECKIDTNEVVLAGQKLKESKKKSKMVSAQSNTSRDWGKGMACVGRSKQCTIVPPNHFGAIPGVEVGSMWKFRVQVSEAGVHRPHVAGIHGRDSDGAYSLVLAGGYEDDQDDGDTFTYTGSGGRDLSGNKRTAEQSCDQTLTRMNRALAKNCNAPLDAKKGAEAKDWKGGKPVRVVRNCKGRKHSNYAPEEGNRYDGLYKIVKYWPDKGKSGFIVWRYQLKRDDPIPAPWTKPGKQRIEQLGLTMQYPEGWQESNNKESEEIKGDESAPKGKGKGKGRKGKRKRATSDDENESEGSDQQDEPAAKRTKVSFKVDSIAAKHIKEDSQNQKLWNEAMECTPDGLQKFIAKVTDLFTCICCQEIVYQPVTTECTHNICRSCLKRSFKADVHSCPTCRSDLGSTFKMETNSNLQAALSILFPGYESGR